MVRPYRLVALCRGLGAASYMLYALHKPAYQLFYGLITVLWPQSSATLSPLIGALFLGLLLLVCLGLTRRYERTIRDWLSRR
jgi:peptidoglycan/LPS O-acetylase OafA/YrhL